MSTHVEFGDERVLVEASVWVAELHGRLPTSAAEARECEAKGREFIEWVKQSPTHVAAFLHADDIFCRLAGVKAPKHIDLQALKAGYLKQMEDEERLQGDAVPLRALSRCSRRSMALAASVLITLGGSLLWYTVTASPEYTTAIGEQREVKLPDGSLMVLNTQSEATIEFSGVHRIVHLLSGEAFFDVRHDASRPFIVVTPTAHVRAVGTRFDVYQHAVRRDDQDSTTVSVLEGVVQVVMGRTNDVPAAEKAEESDAAAGSQLKTTQPARLGAGEQINISPAGVHRKAKADVSDAVAWRERNLVFEGTPLSEVAQEYNRYNSAQIRIEAPDLAQRQLSGTYSVDRPDLLVQYLEEAFPVTVTRIGRNWIVRSRPR